MIRPIVAYGDPILKKKAIEINIDEPGELKSLIKDLWDTMYNAKGVGIAAPQIGISKSIFVALSDSASHPIPQTVSVGYKIVSPDSSAMTAFFNSLSNF